MSAIEETPGEARGELTLVAPTVLTTGFDAFFRRTFPSVARAAALLVREWAVAEEIAQESFLRLLTNWEKIESEDHARNFVYRVAVNLSRSHLRRQRTSLLAEDTHPETDGSEMTRVEDRMFLEGALEQLTPRQRSVLVLVDYADFSATAAAKMLRIRPATARVHLARARQTLRGLSIDPEEER